MECPACAGSVAPESLNAHLRRWHLGTWPLYVCAHCAYASHKFGDGIGHALLEGHPLSGVGIGCVRAKEPVLSSLNANITPAVDSTAASTVSGGELDISLPKEAQLIVLELSTLDKTADADSTPGLPVPLTEDSIIVEKILTNPHPEQACPVAKDSPKAAVQSMPAPSTPDLKSTERQGESPKDRKPASDLDMKDKETFVLQCAQCSSSFKLSSKLRSNSQQRATIHALGCRKVKAYVCSDCGHRAIVAKHVEDHISRMHPYNKPRPVAKLVDKEENEKRARAALSACFPDAGISFAGFR